MKKFLALCLACFIANSAVEAKDYAKLQIKEMKKSLICIKNGKIWGI